MSIATQLFRLTEARDIIKTKLIELGLVTGSVKIDECATIINNIANLGELNITVDNETIKQIIVPAGYTSGGIINVTVVTHYYFNDIWCNGRFNWWGNKNFKNCNCGKKYIYKN